MRWWTVYLIVGVTTALASILLETSEPAPIETIARLFRERDWRRGTPRSDADVLRRARLARKSGRVVMFLLDSALWPIAVIGIVRMLRRRKQAAP
jgi:hypothetical protein